MSGSAAPRKVLMVSMMMMRPRRSSLEPLPPPALPPRSPAHSLSCSLFFACVELKMGPSGHMDSTGIFPDSNTREFGPRRTTQRQPPRPTHKCNAPRLPFHVHLTHDLTRAASALPLHTAALAFVSFGIVLVQVQVQVQVQVPRVPLLCRCAGLVL